MTPRAVAVLAASGALAVVAACTAFSDLTPPGASPGPDASEGSTEDPLPAPGLLSLTEAAKVCSLVAQCSGLGESITASLRVVLTEPSFSLCLTELATTLEPKRPGRQLTAAALREIANAPTCAAALARLTIEIVRVADPRCPDAGPPPPDRCLDDMTALHCLTPGSLFVATVRHCGRPSRTADERCFPFDGGAECAVALGCTDPGCVGPALDACRPSDKDRRYHTLTDCNLLGMQCIVGNNADIGCSTSATETRTRQPVDGETGAYCEGSRLVTTSESYFGTIDCADFGGSCVQRGEGAICKLPQDECSPLTMRGSCEGTTLNACVGGKPTSFDCASIGKTCATQAGDVFPAACR